MALNPFAAVSLLKNIQKWIEMLIVTEGCRIPTMVTIMQISELNTELYQNT